MGGEVGVEGLESDMVIGFGIDSFECCLVVGEDAYVAVGAGCGFEGGREDDDVALDVLGEHGFADDACGEGVGIVNVRCGDVFICDSCGEVKVGEVGGVAGGDFVDDGDA